MAPDCDSDSPLAAAEANVIRQITYESQSNYFESNSSFRPTRGTRNWRGARGGYGSKKGGMHTQNNRPAPAPAPTPASASTPTTAPAATNTSVVLASNSVAYKFEPTVGIPAKVQALLSEGSAPNKRGKVTVKTEEEDEIARPSRFEVPMRKKAKVRGMQKTDETVPRFVKIVDEPAEPQKTRKRRKPKDLNKPATIEPIRAFLDENTGQLRTDVRTIRDLLEKTMVEISILEFLDWSTPANKELKRLATKPAKKKKAARVTLMGTSAEASAEGVKVHKINDNQFTKFLASLADESKPFHIPTSIRVSDKEHDLKLTEVQADQGSEINIISIDLVKKYGLELIPLKKKGFAGLTIVTADHKSTKLEYSVNVEIGVKGIWRKIACFVMPETDSAILLIKSFSLLLGLPWLYAVTALIFIRDFKIFIGSSELNEEP